MAKFDPNDPREDPIEDDGAVEPGECDELYGDIDDAIKKYRSAQQNSKRERASEVEWRPNESKIVQSFSFCGIECVVMRGAFSINGYAKVPRDHHYDRLHYHDIEDDISVHGGLTFSQVTIDGTWFGFDTCHHGDWIDWTTGIADSYLESVPEEFRHLFLPKPGRIWTVDDVARETKRLAAQLSGVLVDGDD